MGKLTRSELRNKIMTILYQINVYTKNNMKYDVDEVIKEVVEMESEFVKEVVYGVITHEQEIIDLANSNLKDWALDRLGHTDQAILKMGIFELVYTETPDIVCINEAVELAKLYSDDEVRKMINSVLDKVYHSK